MDNVVKISEALRTNVTALPVRSTAASVTTRLTDTELARMEAVAKAVLPSLPPCDGRHFDQCLRVMRAALPSKNADDLSGELLVAAYRRKLGHMPAEQISFIADQALERCRWFPTIAECLEIAGRWERDDAAVRERNLALASARWEKQQRMEEAMAAICSGAMSEDEINDLPERWTSIAETRGLLMMRDGKYVVRPSALTPTGEPA